MTEKWECNPSNIDACLNCPLPDCKYDERAELPSNYQRDYHRTRKKAAIAAGLCSKCWKRPADEGYTTCTECRTKMRESKRKTKENAHGGGNRRERKVKHSTESITRNEGKANVKRKMD